MKCLTVHAGIESGSQRIGQLIKLMSKSTRNRYSAEFKAKVAIEAIKGELTISRLVAKHGVHQTMINAWKKQAIDKLSTIFENKSEIARTPGAEVEKLHTKIGQLVAETRFFRESLRSLSVDRRRQMIDSDHPSLSIARQCQLVSISRSGYY